jgi:small subunit ribosomal protein S21
VLGRGDAPVARGRLAAGIRLSERTVTVQVFVRDNDVDDALRQLKRKLRREGVFRELKRRRAYEKPSERRAREKIESARRRRKVLRKRLEREGY